MRVVNNCLLLTVVLALLLCSGCGGRKSPASTPLLRNQAGERPTSAAASDFTAEDYKVMAMPYNERLAYLEDKLKKLVFEMHGITIEAVSYTHLTLPTN